jgi:outer membrane receptor protein involved in Fe transport
MFPKIITPLTKTNLILLIATGSFLSSLTAQDSDLPNAVAEKEAATPKKDLAIPDAKEAESDEDEMVFLMDDFVVSAEDDQGYYSANTLAGTRTNELTKNIPMTISTVNKELIEDFGMQTLADMGNYVPSIESEGSAYNNSEIRFRGFLARNSLFEFMPRYSPLDYYIVERADIIRGANSLIYGQADPGGKVNIISKVANLSKNQTRVGIEMGDHKFIKTNLDTNIVLNDQAAVRFMATDSYKEFTQDHRFQEYTGLALEASYAPTNNTRFRFHIDGGKAKRSLISSTFTMQGGPTGLPRGIVADPKLANLIEDDFLEYLVNYNDGTLRANNPTLTNDPSPINGQGGPLLPDYITGRDSLRELFEGITPENTGTAMGPDAINTKDSIFTLGEVSHRFSDSLEFKLSLAYETVDGESLTPGGSANQIQHSLSTGISYKIPNLDYDSTEFSAVTTQDMYDLTFAPELLSTFNANDEATIRTSIQDGIAAWRNAAPNFRQQRLTWTGGGLDDTDLENIIYDAYAATGASVESIAQAHGFIQNELKYLNPDFDLSTDVWAIGNATQSLDNYIYNAFDALDDNDDTNNSINRPRNTLGRQAWALEQFVDLEQLNTQIVTLGAAGITAILDTTAAIPNYMPTNNGGQIALTGVDQDGNQLVNGSTERDLQRTQLASEIADLLVAGSGGSSADLWTAIRGVEDLFQFYLHPEDDNKWMWTNNIFPALISNVGALTTNAASTSGELNPSLYNSNNEILVPFTRSLWQRSYSKDENISARLTLNYTPKFSFLPGEQQFLFGLDLDKRKASQRREEQFQEGSLVYGNGVVLNRDSAYNYALLNEILSANYVQRFDMNQSGYDLPGGAQNALVTLRNLPVNEDNLTVFREAYAAETEVDTTGLWTAVSSSYFNGRFRTLIGGRVDTIDIKSDFQDYKIRELPRGFDENGNPVVAEPNTNENSAIKYNDFNLGFGDREEGSTDVFFTPSVGALFWITDQLGVFGNYSKSVISPTGFQYDIFGVLTPPETGEGQEIGIKFASEDGKINAQIMAFRIDKKNDQRSNLSWPQMQAAFPASDPANSAIWDIEIVRDNNGDPILGPNNGVLTRATFDPLGFRIANEEIRSQGIEVDFYYNPTNQLSFFLGYAFLDTTILRSSLPILEGLEVPGTAAHNINLTARYAFPSFSKLKGCFVSVNQKYRSGALLDNYFTDLDYDGDQDFFVTDGKDPKYYSLRLEDQMITDFSFGWSGKLGSERNAPRARIQLTVNNLFNALDLYSTGTNRARYTEERSYRLSASLTF